MKLPEIIEWCEGIRSNLEKWIDEENQLTDYFDDGAIYGDDAEGNLIIGFGVYGGANILLENDCVSIGDAKSRKFSTRLEKAVREFKHMLDNC